jgi:hypothetical protein
MDWNAWWDAHGETVWASLAAIVITAVISFIFYRKAEKPKRLGWEVRSKSRIINASGNQRANLNVVYRDQEVASPNIIVVRVGNVGKRAIPRADIPEPIKITLSDAKLLATEIVETSNPDIKASLGVSASDQNVIELEPELFNKGEWLEIQLVTDGRLDDPAIHARVADGEVVEVLSKDNPAEKMRSSSSSILLISMTSVIIVLGGWLFASPTPSRSGPIMALGIGTVIGYITLIALTIRGWRRRRYRWAD